MKENIQEKGFTLIELLIAMTLMAVISITSTQILRSTTANTKKITEGMGDLNRFRSVFKIMRNDFLKAFNYRDLNMFLYNEAQKERAKRYDGKIKSWVEKYNKDKNPNPPVTVSSLTDKQREDMVKEIGPRPEGKPNTKKETIVTHFKGDKEKVYFTTSSGVRFRSKDKVSNLTEVGYFLKTCKSRKFKKIESKCLWRSVSYNLDGEITEGGSPSVILENVKKFEFSYLIDRQKDKPEWIKSWDSTDASDERYGSQFPGAVKLNVTVDFPRSKDGKKVKTLSLSGVFKIEFPNNNPFKDLATTNTKTPPPPGGI